MLEVLEVKSKKQQKDFLEFPNKLYKDNPYFVPALYADEKKIFRKDYLYYDTCKAVYFNCYLDGIMSGRISGIIQYAANKKYNQKRVRFTRFDCIDNQEVANALFEAIFNFAKENKMDEIVGPLGFSDLEREGLLIEGFDYLSTFEEQYNYSYYQKLIENLGFVKEIDWVEHRLTCKEKKDEKMYKLSKLVLERYHLKFAKINNINKFIKEYADQLFKMLDKTYDKLYGTVPFTEGMKKLIISNFKAIVNFNYMGVIVNEQNEIVCFGIAFPGIGSALKKSGGHLSIRVLLDIYKNIKHPKIIDLGLIGVDPKYEMKGVASAFITMLDNSMRNDKACYAETNLNLEDNAHIINQWKNFDVIRHKRRRSYVKKIDI